MTLFMHECGRTVLVVTCTATILLLLALMVPYLLLIMLNTKFRTLINRIIIILRTMSILGKLTKK